jgi:hypothetical protein
MSDKDNVRTLGETAEHAWMLEFMDRCFPEMGDRVNADLNLAMAMCKAEPKHAQVAMQWLAQEIRSGKPDPATITLFRFVLGALFMAYCAVATLEGRCASGEVPSELQFVLKHYPEIIQCANEVSELQS